MVGFCVGLDVGDWLALFCPDVGVEWAAVAAALWELLVTLPPLEDVPLFSPSAESFTFSSPFSLPPLLFSLLSSLVETT